MYIFIYIFLIFIYRYVMMIDYVYIIYYVLFISQGSELRSSIHCQGGCICTFAT